MVFSCWSRVRGTMVLLYIGDRQFLISRAGAVDVRFQVPEGKVSNVATRSAVLKEHQQRDNRDRHAILHDDAQWQSRDLAGDKMSDHIGKGRDAEHDEQVFKFEAHKSHACLQVSVYWCNVE